MQALELELVNEVAETLWNPLAYVQRFYPWKKNILADSSGPRKWQSEILVYLRDWFTNKETRHSPCRIAVASGHGIGKSAFMGMVTNWAMSTCDDCKVLTTAGT